MNDATQEAVALIQRIEQHVIEAAPEVYGAAMERAWASAASDVAFGSLLVVTGAILVRQVFAWSKEFDGDADKAEARVVSMLAGGAICVRGSAFTVDGLRSLLSIDWEAMRLIAGLVS